MKYNGGHIEKQDGRQIYIYIFVIFGFLDYENIGAEPKIKFLSSLLPELLGNEDLL